MDTSKIIKGVVNSGRYTVTAPIVKEDYGLYLQIEGVELPSTYEVDFSNSENSGTSVTMIGNADGVLIPRQFIDSGKDVFAFLYHVGSDFGRTVYKFRIPNKVRPDRTEDTPTPEEQSVIDQAISALNEAVEQTSADVASADQSAQSASSKATEASGYASTASAKASEASQSATTASNKASEASGYATSASQAKTDAESARDSAQGYAQRAEDALEEFTTPTASATTLPEGSNATASYADGNFDFGIPKGDTGESPVTLRLSKDVVYVPMDREYRTKIAISDNIYYEYRRGDEQIDGIMDYTGTLTNTNITCTNVQACTPTQRGYMRFTIPQGVPLRTNTDIQLVVNIRFVFDYTDLDGNRRTIARSIMFVGVMDGEQGEPGAKGNPGDDGDSPTVTITPITGGHRITITDNDGTKTFDVMDGDDYILTEEDKEEIADMVEVPSDWLKAFPTDIASGSIASFSDGADGLPLKSLVVDINPIQDLSNGDPSPENICPISGWTEVNVNHSDAVMTNPTTLTIQLGQTVYGGKLDVLSGVMTVDRAMVDLGTLNWDYYTSGANPIFRVTIADKKANADMICSNYEKTANFGTVASFASNAPNGSIASSLANTYIACRDDAYTSASDFKTAVSGVQLCYELATPLTIQLTPNQVNSLLGVNNIWADSGDTTCVYRADTKLYIERLTAPDSADMIADANITSGQYFMVGNSLFKATANIANGSAIIVGTNCIRKSLSDALNEINA